MKRALHVTGQKCPMCTNNLRFVEIVKAMPVLITVTRYRCETCNQDWLIEPLAKDAVI
jgi:transposase-like protein